MPLGPLREPEIVWDCIVLTIACPGIAAVLVAGLLVSYGPRRASGNALHSGAAIG